MKRCLQIGMQPESRSSFSYSNKSTHSDVQNKRIRPPDGYQSSSQSTTPSALHFQSTSQTHSHSAPPPVPVSLIPIQPTPSHPHNQSASTSSTFISPFSILSRSNHIYNSTNLI
ncbi:hypothetical protein WR25_24814 [Diploscapter pachys]|uniref:Uncharacterized protein n=1 Tax=Diploscapter pachys TaxID=2018661 RepID=A0A2A2KQV9_9BILA|nr:hypothetical protein WR25_24814 [Diploscapter pachys]